MPHRPGIRTLSLALCTLPLFTACDKGGLKGPEAEVKKTDVKLDLPGIPPFDLPPAPSDGSHTVKELRVKGKKLLDTPVTVHGFITFVYDCPTAVRQPGQSDKDVAKMIEDDPTKCERPKFYIGDTKETPPEKSLWVVDVPRPYNTLELKRLPKEELKNPPPDRCDPKDTKTHPCPPYAVGDEIEITGDFKLSSPHSERNSEGLVVYKKLKNVTQNWESPEVAETPAPGGTPTTPPPSNGRPSPEDLVKNKKSHS